MTCNCDNTNECFCCDSGACDPCSSNSIIKEIVDDALAGRVEEIDESVEEAKGYAEDSKKSAADAAESASAAAQSQTNAETAAGVAVDAAKSVTDTAIVLEETAEKIKHDQEIIDEKISALQTKPVYFNVQTETSTLQLPEMDSAYNVRSLYIEGVRQDVGYGFEFDKATQTVTLAEPITTEDIDNSPAGQVPVTVIIDAISSDDPTSLPLVLESNAGAGLVGTTSGNTVQVELDNNKLQIENLKSHEIPGAKNVGLPNGTVYDALRYVTPEMFGAVGDGSADDSDAIIAAMTYANTAAVGLCAVRGDGVYRIDKGIPCKNGYLSVPGSTSRRFGFSLYLNVVLVGEGFPALPEKWWEAEAAFYPSGNGSVENFNLHVNQFHGGDKATFFKVTGNGLSTSLISCDEMRGHIIGFKNYVDPVAQSGMNKIRGKNWQTGYIAVLVGGMGNGRGNSECHNIDITWCATHRYGAIHLQDRSQYANVNNGTYDYNGKNTSVLTLSNVQQNGNYSVEFGFKVTGNGKESYALSSAMRGYEGAWQLLVTEDADVTDGTSKWAVGDTISTEFGFSATIEAITVASTKTAIYPDIIISNRTGDFAKVHIAADYVGGIYGHNLFTCDIWAPSSTQNPRNMSYRGLAISGASTQLQMYSTQHSVTAPFLAVTEDAISLRKDLELFSTRKIKGTSGSINVAHNTPIWAFSLQGGSNSPIGLWKIYVSCTINDVYGEFLVANDGTNAKVLNKISGYVDITTNGHQILLNQTTGSSRVLTYNAIRVM